MLLVCRYPHRLDRLPLQFLSALWTFRDVDRELVLYLEDVRPLATMGKCGMIAHLTISFPVITEEPADNFNLELHGVSTLAMADEASIIWEMHVMY